MAESKFSKNFKKVSVSDARTLWKTIWEQDEGKRRKRIQVRRQLEGGKPYDERELQKDGQGHRSNHNFRDAEAARDRAILPYWDMSNSVPRKATVDIDETSPDVHIWNNVMMQAFDDFIDDWGMDYIMMYQQNVTELINYGAMYSKFEDESPRFKHVKNNKLSFPKGTPLSSDGWNITYIQDDTSFKDFWELVEDDEEAAAASARGWNVPMIKAVLKFATEQGLKENGVTEKDMTNRRLDEWEHLQDEIRNSDLTSNFGYPAVSVVNLYRAEKGKKVSHRILLEIPLSRDSSNPNNAGRKMGDHDLLDEFLFENKEVEDHFKHLIPVVYWDVATGQVHSVKGFAEKNFDLGVMLNRIKNAEVDSVDINLSVNFKRVGEESDDNPTIENYGPFNVLPNSLEAVNILVNSNEALKVADRIEQNMAENNAQYREQAKQIEETETATQAKILAGLQSQVSRANASLYLAQYGEAFISEMFRRLRKKGSNDKDAKKFQKRCRDNGVPDQVIFKSHIRISSGGSPSAASPAARELLNQEMMSLRNVPGVNSRQITQDFIVDKVGPKKLKLYLPDDETANNAYPIREAMQEEGDLANGMVIPVAPLDNHAVHLLEQHLDTFDMIANGIIKGTVTKAQLFAGRMLGAHIDAHLEFLSQDTVRKAEFKEASSRFRQAAQVVENALRQVEAEATNGEGEEPPQPVVDEQTEA